MLDPQEKKKMAAIRQVPLVCGGHERPVVALKFSGITEEGSYLISASKGNIVSVMFGIFDSWLFDIDLGPLSTRFFL